MITQEKQINCFGRVDTFNNLVSQQVITCQFLHTVLSIVAHILKGEDCIPLSWGLKCVCMYLCDFADNPTFCC